MVTWRRFLQQLIFSCMILLVLAIVLQFELPGSQMVHKYVRFVVTEDVDYERVRPQLAKLWTMISNLDLRGMLEKSRLWHNDGLAVFGGIGRTSVGSPSGR